MKRMHVHVSVESIDHAIAFYSALFAAQPSVVKILTQSDSTCCAAGGNEHGQRYGDAAL